MNLLTLQICKETAQKMFDNPENFAYARKSKEIKEQGRRTLEVIKQAESNRIKINGMKHELAELWMELRDKKERC